MAWAKSCASRSARDCVDVWVVEGEAEAVVVGVDAVKLETGVEPAVVIGAVVELVVTPVVDVPEELDELPAVEADTKLKRSLTTLLTSFCRLDVAPVIVPAAVIESVVSLALEWWCPPWWWPCAWFGVVTFPLLSACARPSCPLVELPAELIACKSVSIDCRSVLSWEIGLADVDADVGADVVVELVGGLTTKVVPPAALVAVLVGGKVDVVIDVSIVKLIRSLR
jgi:hypothetical protein